MTCLKKAASGPQPALSLVSEQVIKLRYWVAARMGVPCELVAHPGAQLMEPKTWGGDEGRMVTTGLSLIPPPALAVGSPASRHEDSFGAAEAAHMGSARNGPGIWMGKQHADLCQNRVRERPCRLCLRWELPRAFSCWETVSCWHGR